VNVLPVGETERALPIRNVDAQNALSVTRLRKP